MSEQQGRVYPGDVVMSTVRPASRLLLVLLVPALFAACTEQHPSGAVAAGLEPLKPAPQQEQAGQQLLASAASAHPAPPPPPPPVAVVDDSSVEEAALVVEEAVEPIPEPTPELAPRALDLAYKRGAAGSENPGQGSYGGDQKGLLPNLFDQDKAGRKVSVSGGVMLDHEQQDVRDSLTGGEVSVKIRTP